MRALPLRASKARRRETRSHPAQSIAWRDYYHCFMGNGLDAVLIGYTGAMVEERAQGNLDRCYWYKADRYYPEERVVIAPNRLPREGQPLKIEGAPWHEIAPLARTWYEVRHNGLRLDVRAGEQRFAPDEGILYSRVDYGAVAADITTFLHARRPLLVIHYLFDRPVRFRAYGAAGVWIEEGYEADPFDEVRYSPDGSAAHYRLGHTQGHILLGITPEPGDSGASDDCAWQEVEAQEITHYFAVVDDQDGPLDGQALDNARSLGYEALRDEQLAFWREYAARSRLDLPDPLFQRFYDYSLYQFKASQNRISGGLPVNNLRLTWSSHVFWDAYFMHQALIEADRREEALEGVRFFARTREHARRHAQEEFGAPGLKWDWELTHDGEKAYGTWLHQKEQMHNNASYANIIWGYYQFTRDRHYLAEFYPILRGLAEFHLANVVERTARGYEVRPLVDVAERVTRVRNEGLNLAGAARVLQLAAQAAATLHTDTDFAARCSKVASGLVGTLDLLYNGRYFTCAEGSDDMNLSSLAPIYPMMIVPPDDPRAASTAWAYLEQEEQRRADKQTWSPWPAGVLATIFAMLGDGDTAWRIIARTRDSLCEFGGMSEHVFGDGHWNMQYFSTAQAAVCTALHHLLLQGRDDEISLFPALPSDWPRASFERLLVAGVEVSGRFDRGLGQASASLRCITRQALAASVRYGERREEVVLQPGQSKLFEWKIA